MPKTHRLPKVLDPKTGEYISPQKLRLRAVAVAVMEPGVTYREVGEKLYPNTEYPAQTVYRSIRSPIAQNELSKQNEGIEQKREQFRGEISEYRTWAKRKKHASAWNNALVLTGKVDGLLIDKQEVTTTDVPSPTQLRQAAEQAIAMLMQSTEQSPASAPQCPAIEPGLTQTNEQEQNEKKTGGSG